MIFTKGDMIFYSERSFIAAAIRFFSFTKKDNGKYGKMNHVGIVINNWQAVEALGSGVKLVDLSISNWVAVASMKDATEQERDKLAIFAREQLGKKYGYGKIAAHLADYLIGDKYIFRRLTKSGNYPICSWVVAWAYWRVFRLLFSSVPYWAAQPDDIWKHVENNESFTITKAIR